ncbi:hypothetical protein DV515_00008498, partial [Chloebia gouldiae]
VLSVTNNTECAKLLEEIKCAHCSPHAQNLFHSPEKGETPEKELMLPYLCKDYCKEFYYTCRGHIPGFLQTTADEFCYYYARKDGGVCFPDFPRKQVRGPASNSLDHVEEYDKEEEISSCNLSKLFNVWSNAVASAGEPLTELLVKCKASLKGGDERGLLSLAFHPNYKKNGKLYVSYTTNQERDFTGSVLRLDVNTDLCNVPYSIPRSNPHFNSTNQPPEIFAHGLHNPGRCAVDRHPTDVNINLTILCSDSNGKNRSSARILQIIKGKDYESEPSLLEFKPFSSGSLVGGFVYRGCQSERLYGSYVFGDRNGGSRRQINVS